jgi:quercetin dioxygenase-like cupin family protein
MDQSEFVAHLRRDGFDEILTKDLEAEGHLGEHQHDWDVRGLVLAGEFTITTSEGRKTYRAGETFFLASRMPHEESQGPEGARLLLGRRRK